MTEDPFEGISGITEATKIVSEERLKIAIVGKPKTGKSWIAATAPPPVFVADFDDRAESLRGKEGVFVKTLIDLNQSMPHAIGDLESDLENFKYRKSQGKAIPASFVFDSMTYMKKWLENEIMKQGGSNFYRVIKASPTKSIRIPQGWDVVNSVRGYMEYFIAEFAALGNVICIFHERDEKDRDKSTAKEVAYTGQVTVDPQYLETLLSTFNEVFRIQVDGNAKYTVSTGPSYEFRGSTTLLIDKEETPNIQEMIKKHKSRLEGAH